MGYLPRLFGAVLLVISLSSYFSLGHIIRTSRTETPHKPKPVCGYEACPKTDPNALNVHLVPHTHNDVGWLKTVDEYYYGSRQNIQNAGVQYILDSVIRELAHDPNKRFIYVETAFLWKWWMEQHDTTRHLVQKLVNNGQLEIISGGWSMNDEAVTHYQSIVDQMTWGFRKLNDTFGSCGRPHIGWQIDPFGHSREQASIFAQMGFDGLFIGRLDYQDKMLRLITKTAEMVWRGSPKNLGSSSDLFTHVLYNNYGPPPGFCFDLLCEDDPFVSNKKSPLYNAPKKVAEEFLKQVKKQRKSYLSNHLIMLMGGDFHFQKAYDNFRAIDILIRHVNEERKNGSKVNVFYSSPSCYLKAVHDANNSYSAKQDDFFPYADEEHSFWTGYYTSKPTIKYFERLGNNFLQVCKQLYAATDLGPEDRVDLNRMREAMGVLQHHDAITGTEKEHVAADYARQLTEGFGECGLVAELAINKLFVATATTEKTQTTTTTTTVPPQLPTPNSIPLESCLLLNISQCEISETSKSFVVTVYNPLARPVSQYVRLPVASQSAYSVRDPTGAEQTIQTVPIPDCVLDLPGRTSSSFTELIFRAKDLPPLGFRSYYVTATKALTEREVTRDVLTEAEQKSSLGNKKLRVKLDPRGRATTLQSNGVAMALAQTFGYYVGHAGNNAHGDRASGAYVFRPNGTLRVLRLTASKVFKGPLVEEVHQTYGDGWISQTVRVYAEENHAEFEWQVGPIPLGTSLGKEVVTRYNTDLETEGTFHTDSNGRELIKRVRNYRPTWKVDLKEKIAGNYYPVTTRILIRDEGKNQEMAVLPDRAEGGSSLSDGEVELMLHRRLLHDDGLGVDEPLDEKRYGAPLIARGRHYVVAGPIRGVKPSLAAQERTLVQDKLLKPWLFLSRADGVTFDQWKAKYKMEYSGVTAALPENVQLLTLEPWKGRSLLVRLEHILEKGEDDELSQPATVNLKTLFSGFTVVSARETTLGGNQWLADMSRLRWQTETNSVDPPSPSPSPGVGEHPNASGPDLEAITLQPMQIRTFVVEISVPSS